MSEAPQWLVTPFDFVECYGGIAARRRGFASLFGNVLNVWRRGHRCRMLNAILLPSNGRGFAVQNRLSAVRQEPGGCRPCAH
jgi:hypothetical protein